MNRHLRVIIILTSVILTCLACEGSDPDPQRVESQEPITSGNSVDPQPKGKRILELDVNTPEDGNYDRAAEQARELGAESIRLSVYWDELETAPGVYQPDPNWLAIANQYYSAEGFSMSLVVSVLDTTEVRVPEDLAGKSFSDPEMISRFQGILEYIHTQLPDVQLISLAIGNEIDSVLGDDLQAWREYKTFYESSAAHARSLWPGLPVSTKVTFEGLTGPLAGTAALMYSSSEVVMTTYYPLEGDFSVRDPAVIQEDFQTLADLFPDKKIHITEIGYPSSPANGSSQAKQAQFIQEMFHAWDQHAERIPLLSYSWLTDLPESSVNELETYYGLRDESFGEFLRTLGLRTCSGAGENKLGFEAFLQEARSRGW